MTKVDHIAATEGVKEAIWLWGLVNEIGLTQMLLLHFVVVKVPIHVTANSCYQDKTKHICV